MKAITLSLTFAMLVTAAFANEAVKDEAQMREAMLRKTGGFVVAPATGRKIAVVDAKSGAPREALDKFIKAVSTGPKFAISLADGNPGETYMPNEERGAVLVIKNDKSCPMTIVVAPEQCWASLNIAPLTNDNPSEAALNQRVTKELWRALVYMLGGGNNQMPACVMKPCVGMKDIDDLKMNQACPEPFREMSLSARKHGIAQAKLTSYRKACVEGWAPPPQNEYQRIVYEQVKAEQSEKPTNPIKILPGQKPSGK